MKPLVRLCALFVLINPLSTILGAFWCGLSIKQAYAFLWELLKKGEF